MIDAKTYLEDIRIKRQLIERLRVRRDHIHMDIGGGGIDYTRDKIMTSGGNPLEVAAEKMFERIEQIDAQIRRLTLEVDNRLALLELLDNAQHKEILFERYSQYLSLEQIAVQMGYNYNYVCSMHGEALALLSDLIVKNDSDNDEYLSKS
ncbi:MAG: hypothetical protein IIY21_21670 [Clostridiales bacterium]|nr:hypothetical protein [Clostridiales bacterium]MBQ1571006.1 hypothetical protein [Clostridiales bacterium]